MPDSVSVSDSIHSPTTQIIKFNGFEGIMHPSLPATENWVFITLLLLLAISALMFVRSSGWVIESMRTFFTVKDRGSIFYKRTMSDFESRLFLVIFSIGVFSLYSYLIINPSGENFSVITFFNFLGITTGFFVLKYLIIKIIAYVFLHPTVQKQTTESYYNVLIYLGLVLFPLLIFQIYFLEDLKHYVKIASLILCLIIERTTLKKIRGTLAPSMLAASRSSFGTWASIIWRIQKTPNAVTRAGTIKA